MVWLIIPNIIWLFDFDSLRLHFFGYILPVHHSHVFVYLYSMRAELHFHSGRSLIFTDWFTILGLNFKHAVLRNYWSNLIQIYIEVSTFKFSKQTDKFEVGNL